MIHHLPDDLGVCRTYPGLVRGLTCSALILLAGCQTYQPETLDRSLHKQEFKSRQASSESVEKFAERLGETTTYDKSFNAEDGLSIGEGRTVALVFNPDLRLARLRAGVAKSTAEHAGLWDDPELSIDVLNITQSVPDPWVIGSALAFTVPVSGRLKVEKQRAEAAKHAELDRVAEAEWEVSRAVGDEWLTWSAQRHRVQQAEATGRQLDSIIGSTSRLADAGEIPKTQAALFAVERAGRRAEQERFRSELEESGQRLRSLMGLSPSADLSLSATLSATSPHPGINEPSESHPSLVRLRSEYEVAEKTLHREIKKQYPDLTFGPQGESDEGQSRIGFVGAIPIPILNSNKGGIAGAAAERELARAAYETEYERLVGRIAVARARLNGLQARRSTIDGTLVPLVDRQVADAGRLVDLGEGGGLVLLESLVRAHEAKLELIDIQLNKALTNNQLRYLIGPENQK
ncbi:MAG: TolC family protein [Verrucomicrobiales bacterium]